MASMKGRSSGSPNKRVSSESRYSLKPSRSLSSIKPYQNEVVYDVDFNWHTEQILMLFSTHKITKKRVRLF